MKTSEVLRKAGDVLRERGWNRGWFVVPHPKRPGEMTLLWARDCVLAWGKASAERRKALGL